VLAVVPEDVGYAIGFEVRVDGSERLGSAPLGTRKQFSKCDRQIHKSHSKMFLSEGYREEMA
jgi:hypothetical protein